MQDPAEDDQIDSSEPLDLDPEWESEPVRISFVEEGEVVATTTEQPESARKKAQRWLDSLGNYPGCGLLESFGWVFAFFVLQIGFSIPIFFVLVAQEVSFKNGPPPPKVMDQALQSVVANHTSLIIGVPLGLTWLVLIPAGWYRQGPKTGLKLNFAAPSVAQFLLALTIVMPLGFVADALFVHSENLFEQLIPDGLAQLQQGTDVRGPLEQLKDYPLIAVLFLIAVMPAVGEEFLFRGIIGRGLINRFGLLFGVTVASLMFAAVHLYPPHVVAILPVGFVIHLVYLNTRSYWMPMLFHFTNNALAVLYLKYGPEGDSVQQNPLWVAFAGGAYVIAALFVLYSIRTRYRLPSEGGDFSDSNSMQNQYVPVMGAEAPPPALGIDRVHPAGNWPLVVAGAAFVVLLAEVALLVWA